ncbi:MAG: hypothetical protein D6725_11170 [Planctomycetota bacterium]|nr:MAG: hypothetical protein D6725_11170 [Planctomycetota bacterium]
MAGYDSRRDIGGASGKRPVRRPRAVSDGPAAALRRNRSALLLAGLLCPLLVSPATAVEVEDHRWGWDGSVIPNRFNLLTLSLRNDQPGAFEGSLEVVPGGPLSQLGFPVVLPELFVSPFGTRSVQLPIFVTEELEHTIRVRDAVGRIVAEHVTNRPPQGVPAAVQLVDPRRPGTNVGLPAFPATSFPASFAPLVGTLRLVVLDFVPRWTAAQRAAFRDWIHCGGILHLYQGPDGSFPEFIAELADLNDDAPVSHVAAGTIIRHRKTLAAARADWDAARGTAGWKAIFQPPRAGTEQQKRRFAEQQSWTAIDARVFRGLRRQTTPNINWDAVFALLIVYTVLVFPGVRLLTRGFDYRVCLAAVVLLAFAATAGIYQIGRRGYGESSTIRGVLLARQTRPGTFLVEARTNVFVTATGRHTLRAVSSEAAFGPSDELGSLFGRTLIYAGARPGIQSTIPLFSSFTFRHTFRTTDGPSWRLRFADGEPARAGVTAADKLLLRLDGPQLGQLRWSVLTIGPRFVTCTYSPQSQLFRATGKPAAIPPPTPHRRYSPIVRGSALQQIDFFAARALGFLQGANDGIVPPSPGRRVPPNEPISLYFACDLVDQPWKDAFLLANRDLGPQRVTVVFRVDLSDAQAGGENASRRN